MSDFSIRKYENIIPVATIQRDGCEVKYFFSNKMSLYRAQSIFDKEPDTVKWIAGFGKDQVLLDIGANVRAYTIWSVANRRTKVFTFEMEPQNYAILNRNTLYNVLGYRVMAYCAALSNEEEFSILSRSSKAPGGSGHAQKENVYMNLKPGEMPFKQGSISIAIDALVSGGVIPLPTHIMIDVDGFEHKVVDSGTETFVNPAVSSVTMEINSNLAEHRAIIRKMEGLGFTSLQSIPHRNNPAFSSYFLEYTPQNDGN